MQDIEQLNYIANGVSFPMTSMALVKSWFLSKIFIYQIITNLQYDLLSLFPASWILLEQEVANFKSAQPKWESAQPNGESAQPVGIKLRAFFFTMATN